ncbi:TlpA family protein disulfide reductase [Halorientalis brevis]|uniref:TlpA family protein disulfide reductase n=1 Tax=Halorientalis brevis TaxID=1126241 RepID=A0ABD6CB67_9EURY|nr:TlpA disulfide reductase family protein [Halorientalis brevis]
MEDTGRRGFLAGSATAVAALAGCTQIPGLSNGSETTPQPISLQTLDVGGSPGDRIRVQPSGEVALLDFFATYCEPCKPQMAELRTVRSNSPDLHMLSITWENELDGVREFWRQYEGTWPVAADTKLKTSEQYGINGLPTMVIIDADGEEVWRHKGLAKAETIQSNIDAAQQ